MANVRIQVIIPGPGTVLSVHDVAIPESMLVRRVDWRDASDQELLNELKRRADDRDRDEVLPF